MSSVFSQITQYIAGVTQGAATSAAAEAASGNYSMGNLNYNNQSSFNTSANHFDTSGRVSGGMYTTQMGGGSTLSMTPDGSVVMNNQGAISNLGVTANIAQSMRASYMKQADAAETAGYNQLKASSDSMATAIRSMYEFGSNTGNSKSSGESWSLSSNSGVTEAINNVHRLTNQFAHNHNMSYGEASSVLGSAYAEAHAGGNVGGPLAKAVGLNAGASAGYKRSSDNTESINNSAVYSDARNFVSESGFSSSVNTVQNAIHDQSLRTSNEAGDRLLNNIGSSLDNAQALRNEATSSFQQAQSYRESATLAEENSVNINSNASQVVYVLSKSKN
jgi:conjugal transfer mating pair stabilization protein TraG